MRNPFATPVLLAALAAAAATAIGCDECLDGAVRRCTCATGTPGMQTCAGASFGTCFCTEPPPPPRCGDTFCDPSERGTCPADCGAVCGDGTCSFTESAGTCAVDCPPICGDRICSAPAETRETCADCGPVCGDGRCEASRGEICPGDCHTLCGDRLCDLGEGPECIDCGTACEGAAAWTLPLSLGFSVSGVGGPAIAARDGRVLLAAVTDRIYLVELDGSEVVQRAPIFDAVTFGPAIAATDTATLVALNDVGGSVLAYGLDRDGAATGGGPIGRGRTFPTAVAAGDEFWVAWASAEAALVRRLDPRGEPFEDALVLPAVAEVGGAAPALAVGPDRLLLVAWNEGAAIVARILRPVGDPLFATDDLAHGSAIEAPPVALWNGDRFYVAWVSPAGPVWTTLDPAGAVLHEEPPPSDAAPPRHLALAPRGDHVTLVETTSAFGEQLVFVSELAPEGTVSRRRLTCGDAYPEVAVAAYDPTTTTTTVAFQRLGSGRPGTEIAIAPLAP